MATQLKLKPEPAARQSLSDLVRPYLGEFAKRSPGTEKARMVPEENIEIIRKLGFVRAYVPAVKGGDERDLWDYCDGIRTLTQACPATGWVTGVLNTHPAAVGLFDRRVQDAIWATGPDTIICSSGSPQMKATLTEGGILVSGKGRWASGCDHAEWALVGIKVPDVSDPRYADRRYNDFMFFAHRSEYTIEDTWYSTGQRGSGSKDLAFDNVFVAQHRLEGLGSMNFGITRGAATVDSWITRTPYTLVFSTFLPAIALGCADGMIAEFKKRQQSRKNAYTGAQGVLNPAGYMRLAESVHELEAITVYFRKLLEDLQAIGVEGKRVDDEMFFGFTSKFAFVTDRAVKVIDRLFEGAGSSAIADFNPMQRYWRDGHAARLHTGSDYDTMLQNYGRSIMGLMPTPDL